MKGGMAVAPMNIRLHPDEHAYMLNDSGARILIYGAEFRPHQDTIRGCLTTVEQCVCVDEPTRGDLDFDEVRIIRCIFAPIVAHPSQSRKAGPSH
jgi:hypothetical protein